MTKYKTMTKYKKTPLKEVILRLDFDKTTIEKIQQFENIKKIFKNESFNERTEKVISINWSDKWVENPKVEEISTPEYIFSDINNNSIKITNTCIILRYIKYNNHVELFKHVNIIEDFIKTLNIKLINRIWLRYVNIINNFDNWFLDNNLIWNYNFILKNNKTFSRIMSNLNIDYNNNCNIEFNHWFWNTKIAEFDYILDIDCISKLPIWFDENISDIIMGYHKNIIDLFELSITKKYRNILNSN